jgi:hypothetical protein
VIGSVLIATLSTSIVAGIEANPEVPSAVKSQAAIEMSGGVPFLSDTQLVAALDDAKVPAATAERIVDLNADSRLEALHIAFVVAALLAIAALFFTGRVPRTPVGTPGTVGADRSD